MEKLSLRLIGETPLLMHAATFADPLHPATKAHKVLTGKRKKTDEDHEAIAKSEWTGSLHWDAKLGPFVPTMAIRATVVNGAQINKLGMDVKRGTLILEDKARLEYDGPRSVEALWADGRFRDARPVVVNRARLIRYRPVFEKWAVDVTFLFDPTVLDRDALVLCAQNAGRLIGLGDFRPNCGGPFGRFRVEVA